MLHYTVLIKPPIVSLHKINLRIIKRDPEATGFEEGSFTDLGPYIILQDHCRPQSSSV